MIFVPAMACCPEMNKLFSDHDVDVYTVVVVVDVVVVVVVD